MISGAKPSWRPVISSISVLFRISINHLDDGAKCTLSKIMDDSKLRGVADNLNYLIIK